MARLKRNNRHGIEGVYYHLYNQRNVAVTR